ncbi:rab3 GTPase-activating protein non-catalytic subunit [Amyelois transitella]|uniref:rab3 GTPase-activating protein non-catalytic subunit n=1 Tax=Amyelois transitella TaxID=680683 RepID=UPI00067C8F2F|nr:rab3 GTPase-activating protein non-catalytic subunit [Amyelois transitella]
MSCEIEQFADCGDILSIGRALFVPEKEDTNWLTQCPMSLSSCGNLLAVGYKNRLCLLTSQWISSTDSNTYIISWSGTLPAEISVILALPICPTKHSSQNVPDWFCIIVGFKNGSIGFYTNTGHLLLLEKLEDKPVMKITCHTGTYGTLSDDVIILFPNSECIVSGPSLFQTLKNAKAQLARVQAGVLDEYSVDSRNINIRRWTFTADQDTLNDAEMVGIELKNTYDHLLAASTYGGYDTWYRSVPAINYLILGAGVKPYVGFHNALEGGTTPPLQDVARAVAHKIKSALPGWLGGSNTETAPTNTEPLIRSESLYMRYGLYDSQRQGTSVVVSPDRRLAAITDNFGRIAVLDVKKGYLIRLFKGYRDAQCGFVQLFDVENNKPQVCVAMDIKRAIFLIIYNPKKGLIDIRLMQSGTRVGVFTATKNGKLLYNTCGFVGTEKKFTHKKVNLPEFQCVLIDPDGKLKQFNIPFFYALEGENSQRSKDLHLLRELKEHIKKGPENTEEYLKEIIERATELQTLELKKYCIDLLLRKYNIPPKVIMSCLDVYWNSVSEDSDTEAQDIKNYFNNVALITLFYRRINNEDHGDVQEFIDKITDKHHDELAADLSDEKDETPEFHLLDDDNCVLEKMLNMAQENYYKEHQHAKVKFAEQNDSDFKELVSCFVLDGKSHLISLKANITDDKLNSLASSIFKKIFAVNDLKLLTQFVKESNIDPKDVVKLIIIHIMNMPLDQIQMEMIEKLIAVIYYLCRVSEDAVNVSYNEISPWWDEIRDMLVDMPCPLRTMIVAMVCKAVDRLFEMNSSEDEAWESVTKENAKWGLLIGKLEDISILSIVLMYKDDFKGNALPKLTFDEFNINLKFIYNRGKGSITELIAKWLCSMGVSPEAVIANELMEQFLDIDESTLDDSDEYEYSYLYWLNNRVYVDDNPVIFKWLSLLRRQFPLSTLATYIIANMCWEYAKAWQNNMQKTMELKAITSCITKIRDVHIKLGLYTIIWSTYIKNIFEATCKLVNKVGRLPKDPLCQQDLGFDSTTMLSFLEFTTDYLERFFILRTEPINQEKSEIRYEKIWHESMPSLVEVAQETKLVNVDILNLNIQVSCSTYYHCHFNFKFSKPLDILYDVDYQYIFDALTGNVVLRDISLKPSDKLRVPRKKFLTKLIRSAIDTITVVDSEARYKEYKNRECMEWAQKINRLAKLWYIGTAFVKRQEAIGLYHLGYDTLAEKAVMNVAEPEEVQPALLAISIQRMKRSLECASNPREWIVNLTPNLYRRVRDTELDTSIPAHPSLETTVSVLDRLLYKISERPEECQDIQNNKLTELIIENCEVLYKKKLSI